MRSADRVGYDFLLCLFISRVTCAAKIGLSHSAGPLRMIQV
jgi:hypothetical protein